MLAIRISLIVLGISLVLSPVASASRPPLTHDQARYAAAVYANDRDAASTERVQWCKRMAPRYSRCRIEHTNAAGLVQFDDGTDARGDWAEVVAVRRAGPYAVVSSRFVQGRRVRIKGP